MAKKKITATDELVKQLRNIKWVAWVFVIYIIFIGLGNISDSIQSIDDLRIRFFTSKEIDSDQQLYEDSLLLSEDLLNFIDMRKQNDPALINFLSNVSFQDRTNAILEYHTETVSTYNKDFLPTAILLRNEFLKRGVQNDNFEFYYKNPTNYFGYTDVAVGLIQMAAQLNSTRWG